MPSDKTKLLFVTNTIYSFGGGEKLAMEIASRITDQFDVTIASPISKSDLIRVERSVLEKQYLNGIKVADLKTIGFNMKVFEKEPFVLRFLTPGSALKLTKLINDSDVIYYSSLNPSMLLFSVVAARLARKRFILGIHNFSVSKAFEKDQGIFGNLMNSMFIFTLSLVHNFHVTNSRDLKLIKNRFPNAEVEYIPNFITKVIEEVHSNDKEFICLFVGRLEKNQKGVDLLAKIIEITVAKERNIIFEIVGSGGDGETLIAELAKKYDKNVRWLGFVQDERLEKAYEEASLSALTSRGEAFSLAVLESQNRGLPTISFDIPGPKGIIKTPLQGRTIPPFDLDKFSEAIILYYQKWKGDKERYAQDKEGISKLVNEEYGTDRVIPKLRKLLKP